MSWTANASAVSAPIEGSASAARAPKWRRAAHAQSGAETAYAGTVIWGERKPSGTCTLRALPAPRALHGEEAGERRGDRGRAGDDARDRRIDVAGGRRRGEGRSG